MKKYQLPNRFKKIGIGILILSFIALIANKMSVNDLDFRAVAKYGLLIGLLLMSISKEEIEDELIIKLRMQSYAFAFIVGAIYSIFLPFVDYFVDFILQAEELRLKDMGDFMILWFLLSIQVAYFEYLKKAHK